MRPISVLWRGPAWQLPSGWLAQPADRSQANYGLPQQRAGFARGRIGLLARQPEPAANLPTWRSPLKYAILAYFNKRQVRSQAPHGPENNDLRRCFGIASLRQRSPMKPSTGVRAHAVPATPSGFELATAPATRGQAAPTPGAWHIANRQAAARSGMGGGHAELFFDPAATTGRAFRLFTGSNQKLERLVASRADVFEQRHEIGNSTDQPGLQAGATLRSDLGRQTLGAA